MSITEDYTIGKYGWVVARTFDEAIEFLKSVELRRMGNR